MKNKQPKLTGRSKQDSKIMDAQSWFDRGLQYQKNGKFQNAITAYQQAALILNIFIDKGQLHLYPHLALTLNNIGSCLSELNHFENALFCLQSAEKLYKETLLIDSQTILKANLALTFLNLGVLLLKFWRPYEARNYVEKAEAQFRYLIGNGNKKYLPFLAEALTYKGDAFGACGQCNEGLSHLKRAEAIYRNLIEENKNNKIYQDSYGSIQEGLAILLNKIGLLLDDNGESINALNYYEEAEKFIKEEINSGQGRYQLAFASIIHNKSRVLRKLKRHQEALGCINNAEKIYRNKISLGQAYLKNKLAGVLSTKGLIFNDLNCFSEGIDCLEKAEEISRSLIGIEQNESSVNLAVILLNKGIAKYNLMQFEIALNCLTESLQFFKKIINFDYKHQEFFALALINKGAALNDLNRYDEALIELTMAKDKLIALISKQKIECNYLLALTYYHIAIILVEKNNLLIAKNYAENSKVIIYKLFQKGHYQYQSELDMITTLTAKINQKIGLSNNKAINTLLASWKYNQYAPIMWLREVPVIISIISEEKPHQFVNYATCLIEKIIHIQYGVQLYLINIYYQFDDALMLLLVTVINRQQWSLALILIGTTRAQRLAELARANLLQQAVHSDAPNNLRKYLEIHTRLIELAVLLNQESSFQGRRNLDGLAQNLNSSEHHKQLLAEYSNMRHQYDNFEKTLIKQGLLPNLGVDLFDGTMLRKQLLPDEVLVLLFRYGVGDNEEKPTGILLLTREHGQVLTIETLIDFIRQLKSITERLKRSGRGLREGPKIEKMSQDSVANSSADLKPIDAQAEILVQTLSKEFWEPVTNALDRMAMVDRPTKRWWQFWKSIGQKSISQRISTVWLIPTGQLHGLPWQASAPPGLRCRVVPAPWFVQQALNRPKPPAPATPTVKSPLGILAYDAPAAAERQHGTEETELFHLALEQTLIQAVWSEAVYPLTGLDATHPPAAFVALAGHGQSDTDIPGAARVWVGRQDDGERRYVGFGDLWRTPLNLQSIYLSSCVVGMTREVNGEPMGLLSAGLLRGARYLVGWTVPVDDLGVALFSLLYHWAWREHQDPETALAVARQAFLSGDWPEATLALAQQHLGIHIKRIMNRFMEIPDRMVKEKNRLREVLDDLIDHAIDPAANDFIKPFWEALGSRDDAELQTQANRLADGLLARRHHLPCRYVGWFALGCG